MVIYDEPFWRGEGVSGATVATDDLIEVTLDTTQPRPFNHGVIGTYSAGATAAHCGRCPRANADRW